MSSSHTPPSIPHDAGVNQKRGEATLIWAIGAFCIFGWEWIICLPQEYRRIWTKKPTFVSALYLANRYFGLLQFCFVVTLVANAWGPGHCKHVFYWEPVGALISTVLSQMILGTRVYALYAQDLIVGGLLSGILAIETVIGGISISTTSPPAPIPGRGVRPPCGAVMGPDGWLISFWSIPLFYDAVTFALTAWKTFNYWRKDVNTPLVSVIWRDGVLYFFAIFSMNVVNVLIFLTAPKSLRAVNLTPTLILSVILSCRLVLNLRNTHAKASVSANSSGMTPGNRNKINPPPLYNHKQSTSTSEETAKPYGPQSEWFEASTANLAKVNGEFSWPDPYPDGIGGHPTRMV